MAEAYLGFPVICDRNDLILPLKNKNRVGKNEVLKVSACLADHYDGGRRRTGVCEIARVAM
jgi:hypothetical protein